MKSKLSVLFIFLFTGLISSQTENSIQLEQPTTENLWAVQFQILENFKLSSFEGSTISLKRKLSDCSSLRFGISINAFINDTDQESKVMPTTTFQNNTSQNNDILSISFSSQYLWNTNIRNNVSAYCGIGPLFSYGYNKTENTTKTLNYESIVTSESVTSQNTFGLGVSGVVGVEWHVKDNISLLGEYETNASYQFTKRENETSDNNSNYHSNEERKENNFIFQSVGVKLGVSVYF